MEEVEDLRSIYHDVGLAAAHILKSAGPCLPLGTLSSVLLNVGPRKQHMGHALREVPWGSIWQFGNPILPERHPLLSHL